MKKTSSAVLAEISTSNLRALTTIVPETIANGYNAPVGRVFTSADLWNIQRQVKARVQRRNLL